jgi:protein associated with RNAse G/E
MSRLGPFQVQFRASRCIFKANHGFKVICLVDMDTLSFAMNGADR